VYGPFVRIDCLYIKTFLCCIGISDIYGFFFLFLFFERHMYIFVIKRACQTIVIFVFVRFRRIDRVIFTRSRLIWIYFQASRWTLIERCFAANGSKGDRRCFNAARSPRLGKDWIARSTFFPFRSHAIVFILRKSGILRVLLRLRNAQTDPKFSELERYASASG